MHTLKIAFPYKFPRPAIHHHPCCIASHLPDALFRRDEIRVRRLISSVKSSVQAWSLRSAGGWVTTHVTTRTAPSLLFRPPLLCILQVQNGTLEFDHRMMHDGQFQGQITIYGQLIWMFGCACRVRRPRQDPPRWLRSPPRCRRAWATPRTSRRPASTSSRQSSRNTTTGQSVNEGCSSRISTVYITLLGPGDLVAFDCLCGRKRLCNGSCTLWTLVQYLTYWLSPFLMARPAQMKSHATKHSAFMFGQSRSRSNKVIRNKSGR